MAQYKTFVGNQTIWLSGIHHKCLVSSNTYCKQFSGKKNTYRNQTTSYRFDFTTVHSMYLSRREPDERPWRLKGRANNVNILWKVW